MTAPTGTWRARWLGRRYLLCIGRFELSSYLVMLYVGCVTGAAAGAAFASTLGIDPARFILATMVLLIPALGGSRLYYVMQNWGRFRAEPSRIWRRGESGGALYGGLVLSFVLSIAVLRVAGIPFWGFWDSATITMLVGLWFTRFGCLMHGCCAGTPTKGPLGALLPNHRGEWRRRVPTQMLEAAFAIATLVAIIAIRNKLPSSGLVFSGGIAWYAAVRMVLEPFRESDDRSRTLVTNLLASLALLAGGLVMLFFRLSA